MGELYTLLDLEDKTYEATEKEIGTAYRKAALHFHPDKLGENITQKDKDIWLKIQNAYETLIDAGKRKRYDSTMPFDDKIPNDEKIPDAEFF